MIAFLEWLLEGTQEYKLLMILLLFTGAYGIIKLLGEFGVWAKIGGKAVGIGKPPAKAAPAATAGVKPPCNPKGPELATAKELADMEAQLTKKLEAHDKKNDKDFSSLRDDFRKETAELKQSIKELRKEMNDNHRAQTDRILQLLTAKK